MKRIVLFLLGLISIAYGQFAPTSAKTAFKNGISIGTRDSTAYTTNDSLVVVINRQGRMMYRSTDGYWKLLANAASSDYVPYKDAVDNVALGNFRLTARSLRTDSVYANSSAGMYLLTNGGAAVAHWGGGGSVEVDFKGFAGYDANRSASYTARSFTDKGYVDSADALRLRISDTAAMLAGYKTYYPRTAISLTTNGSSGAATYNNATGVFNIPNYGSALSGYVPYTGATANVNLGAFDLTANVITGATGSFSSSGSGNTLDITHSSGSGIALNITKSGNGEGLYINKTSGSGNAATIIGTLNATTLVKSGGTSSQFLKADGSVDGNTYALVSDLNGYVPTSRTLTINGTSFDLSANRSWSVGTVTAVTASAPLSSSGGTTPNITISQASTSTNGFLSSTDWNTFNSKQNAITLTTTGSSGAATLVGSTLNIPNYGNALSGYLPLTGGTMTGDVNWAQTDRGINWAFNTDGAYIKFYNTGDGDTDSRLEFATFDNDTEYFRWVHNGSGVGPYELMRLKPVSDGNSELIVRGKIIKSGGTSSQFLKADGSVDNNTYATTGSLSGYVDLTTNQTVGGVKTFTSQINGTSLSMSGGGSFGGNVGIGTTSPSSLLHINGTASAKITMSGGTTQNGILFNAIGSAPEYYIGAGNNLLVGGDRGIMLGFNISNSTAALFYNSISNDIIFGATSSTEKMRITSGGEVLINTTTPDGTNKLIVNGRTKISDANSNKLTLSGGTTQNGMTLAAVSGAGNEFYIFNGNGGLGNGFGVYNTTTATLPFYISNAGAATFSSSVTATSFIGSVGTDFAATGGVFSGTPRVIRINIGGVFYYFTAYPSYSPPTP